MWMRRHALVRAGCAATSVLTRQQELSAVLVFIKHQHSQVSSQKLQHNRVSSQKQQHHSQISSQKKPKQQNNSQKEQTNRVSSQKQPNSRVSSQKEQSNRVSFQKVQQKSPISSKTQQHQQHGQISSQKQRQQQQQLDQPETGKDLTSTVEGDIFLASGSTSTAGLRRLSCSNIFVGSTSKQQVQVSNAEFVKSSAHVQDCPKDGLPEFALVGRSNVGKSSLINTLVRKKQLAKTSKTPGKTQLINHFIIDSSWYLVDLPGYGFAQAPSKVRMEWDNFTRDYFLKREALLSVLLLIDASVSPKRTDFSYARWLASNKIPLTLVFTKCDKRRSRNRHKAQENVYDFLRWLKEDLIKTPPWIMTSSVNNQGMNELLLYLANLRENWSKK